MTCQCKVCQDTRRWDAAINPQTEEAKAAYDEIMIRLAMAEDSECYWRMKYEGTWPGDSATGASSGDAAKVFAALTARATGETDDARR